MTVMLNKRSVLLQPPQTSDNVRCSEQKERCQALSSSACRVDSSGSRSSSSDGSQSVHRHIKVLMTGLRERNAHSLENKTTQSRNIQLQDMQDMEQAKGITLRQTTLLCFPQIESEQDHVSMTGQRETTFIQIPKRQVIC